MKNFFCLIAVFTFSGSPLVYAQINATQQLLNKLVHEDSATVTSIAIYPQTTRTHILEVCTQPNALVKMETLQKTTGAEFKNALQDLPKEDQQKIWDIARYPKLMASITEGGKKTAPELEKIAEAYPKEMHASIVDMGQSRHDIISKIYTLNQKNEQSFATLANEFPEKTKNAMLHLVKYPEAIALLNENMRTTALAGEIYKTDAQLIQQKMDSISTAYAENNAKELEAWKTELENDPDAKKEMEEAGKEFANYVGYTDDEIQQTNQTVIINYVYEPYPYWFGYPWWYDYPYWYHYPWWYHCGYYWGPYGIVYFGFPTPYYSYWYYHDPYHHYHYSHYTNHFVNHHYGHRQSLTAINRQTSNFVQTTEKHVSPGFFTNDGKRPDRIKELGKFEMNYNEEVKKNPGNKLSREDFHKKNAVDYPNMKPGKVSPYEKVNRPVEPTKPVYNKPVDHNKPPVVKPQPKKPVQPPKKTTKPVTPPKTKPAVPKTTPKTTPKPRKK